MRVICRGTIIRPTTTPKRNRRAGKSIQAKAYAASAATLMGITVEGMVINRLFRKARAMPWAVRISM